ncbi:hypothetical protein QJS66_18610 [Kocuria rhizophila]|nr:hypothetical protein QJS66_18610 [Kocuria rhizophila]
MDPGPRGRRHERLRPPPAHLQIQSALVSHPSVARPPWWAPRTRPRARPCSRSRTSDQATAENRDAAELKLTALTWAGTPPIAKPKKVLDVPSCPRPARADHAPAPPRTSPRTAPVGDVTPRTRRSCSRS